jgi:hypothetical protein
MSPALRAYPSGHFELTIDGTTTPAYLKSAEGGFMKLNSAEAQLGADPIRIKNTTTREVEPITLEVGMSQVGPLWLWIAQSWRREFNRKDGHILYANADFKAQLRHDFFDALIEEVTIPTLDASSKDALFMKMKLRPERINIVTGDEARIQGQDRRSQKLWHASSFRLQLGRYDVSKVNKIDSFTIKQGVKPLTSGRTNQSSFAELEPTKIEFPDLKIHMSMQYAGEILDWYKKVVIEGRRESEFETDGTIEFLSPDGKQVLGEINLYGVGIKGFSLGKSEANVGQIKRCSFDLYVSHMGLNDNDVRMMLEG